jgi:hypothetical protein
MQFGALSSFSVSHSRSTLWLAYITLLPFILTILAVHRCLLQYLRSLLTPQRSSLHRAIRPSYPSTTNLNAHPSPPSPSDQHTHYQRNIIMPFRLTIPDKPNPPSYSLLEFPTSQHHPLHHHSLPLLPNPTVTTLSFQKPPPPPCPILPDPSPSSAPCPVLPHPLPTPNSQPPAPNSQSQEHNLSSTILDK